MPNGSSSEQCSRSSAISRCPWSQSCRYREWRSHRISVSAPGHGCELHSGRGREASHEWVALCIFAGAREKLLGIPEPRLLRVLCSGPMESHAEADVELRVAI